MKTILYSTILSLLTAPLLRAQVVAANPGTGFEGTAAGVPGRGIVIQNYGLEPIPGTEPPVANNAQIAFARATNSSPVAPLILEFKDVSEANRTALEEDLAIMCRLLDQSVAKMGEIPMMSRLGIQFLVSDSQLSHRAVYVQGFGAIFMGKLNIPLFGSNAEAPKPTESSQKPDSDWERARRDIRGEAQSFRNGVGEGEPVFNASFVDRLTKTTIQSLRGAANIRNLPPSESVIVTFFGPASESERYAIGAVTSGAGMAAPAPATSRGTVLTIQAKKADIDAFAAGTLNAETFQSRATVHAYPGAGAGMKSLNSWVQKVAPTGGSGLSGGGLLGQ